MSSRGSPDLADLQHMKHFRLFDICFNLPSCGEESVNVYCNSDRLESDGNPEARWNHWEMLAWSSAKCAPLVV